MQTPNPPTRIRGHGGKAQLRRSLPAVGLALAMLCLAGCELGRFGAYVVGGDGQRSRQVAAQYNGLSGYSVAILAQADDQTLYRHPTAPQRLIETSAAAIDQRIEDVQVARPERMAAFMREDPYWYTRPYGQVLRRLDVDRLIVLDLIEYQTHEPGNPHVQQGRVSANILVFEAEAEDPDNAAFSAMAGAQFPEDRQIGVVDEDARNIETGMVHLFGRNLARLFHDHEVRE